MQTKTKRSKSRDRTDNKRKKINDKSKNDTRIGKRNPDPVILENKYIFDNKKLIIQRKNDDLIIDETGLDPGISNVTESTELGEALKELNLDVVENNRMSGIDMRARLHYMEISNILALDTLVAFKLLPIDVLSFTRQKKRLSVSIKGEGRKEIVQIVGGKQDREQNSGLSWFDKLRGKNNDVVNNG